MKNVCLPLKNNISDFSQKLKPEIFPLEYAATTALQKSLSLVASCSHSSL